MLEMTRAECAVALSSHNIGRVCVVEDGYPIAIPVTYRMVARGDDCAPDDELIIVFRTRPGSVVDFPGHLVGFQIDGIDQMTETGWSVLARGQLCDGSAEDAPTWLRAWDPHPWISDRDTWLYIRVEGLSGRRLTKTVREWAFEIRGYL